ncbi:hypothetical protein ACQP2U_33115 [Nocardia sp. CA-084685]|uniref:hypothetical protein n=1 Tax=Nocardia sp. CA-084685 TaxID=3239970 RepID=UPI003D9842E4
MANRLETAADKALAEFMNNGPDSPDTLCEADATELQEMYAERRNLLDADYERVRTEQDNGGQIALPPNSPGQRPGSLPGLTPERDYGWPAWAQTMSMITGTTTASHDDGSGGPTSPINQVAPGASGPGGADVMTIAQQGVPAPSPHITVSRARPTMTCGIRNLGYRGTLPARSRRPSTTCSGSIHFSTSAGSRGPISTARCPA